MSLKHKKKLKILCISRTYPPVIGGMERVSYHLISNLAKLKETQVTAIVNRRGKSFLPFFIPLALFKAIVGAKKYDIIHLSDTVLAPIGDIVKMFFPKTRVVATIHGLDITYARTNQLYKTVNLMALPAMDRIIAVSRETKKAAQKLKIKKAKITVVPNGIDPGEVYDLDLGRKDLVGFLKTKQKENSNRAADKWPLDSEKTVYVLTLGRLCKRKGVAWFVEKVLPGLDGRIFYVIAGSGTEEEKIKEIIKQKRLEARAALVGGVTEQEKKIVYNGADIFVQPNIKVKGDMEGFGVTLLEAGACGLPVVASRIEGIKDAVIHGSNGTLVETGDYRGFAGALNKLAGDSKLRRESGAKVRAFVLANFNWGKIARRYLEIFKKVIREK
ncbi:MAG: glycosyltransferase family 4 protein [Patescibacteria group bacterium]